MKGWPNLEATTIIDAHVEDYNSLKPGQFCNLRQFKLQQTDEWHQTLILQLNDEAGDRQITLTFQGIIGLEFLPRGFQPIPLYLEVVWIGERQWEGINYQVFNTEQDVRLSFYCRYFQASLQDCDHA